MASTPPNPETAMDNRLPLCFVLMPFGRKPGVGGAMIDFDAVYRDMIAPAITQAGMEPLRADEEQAGGVIHKPMFERLILCEYAVADLTTANANVFYELGLRHGVRAGSTALVFADGAGPLPFDVALLRGLPYGLGADGKPSRTAADCAALTARLKAARELNTDSPVYQMVEGFPDIQRLKTDVFRDRVDYSRQMKDRLRNARETGADAVHAVENELAASPTWTVDTEAAILVDLYLSYRAVKDWPAMMSLAAKMPPHLSATTMVQEQLGFALNRAGKPDDAEAVLKAVIERHGPSSETCGILGRVYKDRWEAALRANENFAAKGWLSKAIETYLQGFESDWRDAYPGVNAVTLMELKEPPDPRRAKIIPVVAYAVERRISAGQPDYWDHATRLELAVLGRDEATATDALENALAAMREKWEPESTARNLRLIRECRSKRGETLAWAADLEHELDRVAA
jgi:hypothetical protein